MRTNKTIYRNGGVKVQIEGAIVVRAANGQVIERFQVSEVDQAVMLADELAAEGELGLAA